MLDRLNKKDIVLHLQDAPESLKKYAKLVVSIEAAKMLHYESSVAALKASQEATTFSSLSSNTQPVQIIEKPHPANKIELYDPDVFGLETAATDCRFEMIKIVREVGWQISALFSFDTYVFQVDAVTKDPKVACDPYRVSQYLSPNIFRMLVPVWSLLRS